MARKRDLFDDTTMSFGEHLEVLRVHVWRSLIGITIGVVICMFFGDRIIKVLKQPVQDALREANAPVAEDDLGEKSLLDFFREWGSEEESAGTDGSEAPEKPEEFSSEMDVEVSREELFRALQINPEVIGAMAAEADDVGDASSDSNDSSAGDSASLTITVRSPEIALFRKAVDRDNQPVAYRVEEAFMTYLKVTLIAGLVLASPWVFYQMWMFVAAGLYPHERHYVHLYLPMSLGLFIAGALFCFYFVFPIVLEFLIGFSLWLGVDVRPRLSEYISLVMMLPVMFGISFQLPLVMLFLERIGIVTVETYTTNWRMAVLIMSITSMLLTPADPSSMLMMLFPLLILYVGGIQLCRMQFGGKKDPLAD